MTEWQPISTAPKDGTEVLVYRKDAGIFMASFREAADEDGECYWFSISGEDLTGDLPTHWMPLPEPPKENGSMTITPNQIPPEAVEAATRKIAKMRGCDKAVFSKCVSAIEAGVPCKCEDEARAAFEAMMGAWPDMAHRVMPYAALILPLTETSTKENDNG